MTSPLLLAAASFQHELDGGSEQKEWSPDTTLYQPYEVEQILMPDNANCLSVRVYLQMLDLPFLVQYRANAENMSPSGKVPFIKCEQFVVAELEPIVDFVEKKGYSLTNNLTKHQLMDMRAYMSLVNTVLGNAESYIVWCDSETAPITRQRCGSVYPFPLDYWVTFLKRRSSKARLRAVGWMKKSLDEVYSEVDSCCKALSDRLGGEQYFFKAPTELDALVFGHIFTILTTVLPTNQFAATVRGYSNLIDHCTRIEKLFFQYNKNETPRTI